MRGRIRPCRIRRRDRIGLQVRLVTEPLLVPLIVAGIPGYAVLVGATVIAWLGCGSQDTDTELRAHAQDIARRYQQGPP
jgi:hypothetical protein